MEDEKPPTEPGETGTPAAPPPTAEAKPPAATAAPAPPRPPEPRADRMRGPRPEMLVSREPLYRESGGTRCGWIRPNLARLRELSGSKGKTDRELGELFLDGQAARLTGAVSEDVPVTAELRVVVDPSRGRLSWPWGRRSGGSSASRSEIVNRKSTIDGTSISDFRFPVSGSRQMSALKSVVAPRVR